MNSIDRWGETEKPFAVIENKMVSTKCDKFEKEINRTSTSHYGQSNKKENYVKKYSRFIGNAEGSKFMFSMRRLVLT